MNIDGAGGCGEPRDYTLGYSRGFDSGKRKGFENRRVYGIYIMEIQSFFGSFSLNDVKKQNNLNEHRFR